MSDVSVPIRLDEVPDLLPLEEELRAFSIRDVRAVRHEDGAWTAHVLFSQYWFNTERKHGAQVQTISRNALIWSLGPRPDRETALAAATMLLTALVAGRQQTMELVPAARDRRPEDWTFSGMVLGDWLASHDTQVARRRSRWRRRYRQGRLGSATNV